MKTQRSFSIVKNNRQLISNSLISKLHELAKSSPTATEFVLQLKESRKLAKDQLESSYKQRKNLFEFLCDFEEEGNFGTSLEEVFDSRTELKALSSEIDFDIKDDSSFQDQLWKTYLVTFFASMRKVTISKAEVSQ